MRNRGYRKLTQRAASFIAAFAIFLVSLVFVIGDAEVARAYTPGTGNGTFNGSSGTTAAAAVSAVALDASGNIYVGTSSLVKKYSSTGVLQWSVNPGRETFSLAVGASPDANIYVGTGIGLRKLSLATGAVDAAFTTQTESGSGVSRSVSNLGVPSLAVQSTGGIIAGITANANNGNGYLVGVATTGLNTSGFTRNGGGIITSGPVGLALNSTNDIYAIGSFTGYLKRIAANGTATASPETTFNTAVASSLSAAPKGIAVDSSGRVYVVGDFTGRLKRFSSAGVEDTTFSSNANIAALGTGALAIAIQGDGKILVGGNSTFGYIKRFNVDGTLDTTFTADVGTATVNSVKFQATTKDILVGLSATPFFKALYSEYQMPNVPPAPTVASGNSSATVTVAAASGPTPQSFTVTAVGDATKTCTVTGSSGSCVVSGLTNGVAYTFKTTATNGDKTTALSPASASVTPADTIAPVYSLAAVNTAGTVLTLTYDEALNATTAATTDFVVKVATVERTVSSVAVSGSTVQLTLASVVGIGQAVTVAYTAPTTNSATSNNAIQDSAGNDAVSFTATTKTVTNSSTADITAPSYSSSAVNTAGTILTLTFDEALNATTAATTAFAVTVNSATVVINSVTVSGSTVQLALNSIVGAGQSVSFSYTAPTSNSATSNLAIQDTSGNDAATIALRSITTNGNASTVDLTPPTYNSVAVNSAGTILTLTYSEALNATTASTGDFAVTVGGAPRAISSVVVSGFTVQLTLASVVGINQAVTVAYTAPTANGSTSNNAIQDSAGNDAVSFTPTTKTVINSSNVDITAPVYSSAVVNAAGTILTLTYGEALNATTAATTSFAVTAGSASVSVTSVTVVGSTVQLGLGSVIERGVAVSFVYTAPATNSATSNNAIQDSAGNDAISVTVPTTGVTNSSTADTTAPVITTAAVGTTGLVLTLTYNEALHATTALTTDFVVRVNNALRTVSSVVRSGSTIQLTLASAVVGGETVSVVYTAPAASSLTSNSAIQDSAGNDAVSYSNTDVTNSSTEGPPRLATAEVLAGGSQMKITWSEVLGGTYPTMAEFTIFANGSPITVNGASTFGGTNYFIVNLSQTITSNQTVKLSYTAPTPNAATSNAAVQDAAGNDAISFTESEVTNSSTVAGDVVAPAILSASLNTAGTVLSLSYDETLNATTAPASSFTVLVNGVEFAVSSVAINSSVVQLTLGSAVEAGNTVLVSYAAPTPNSWATNSAIQDTAGNDAVLLSGYSVQNNSTAGPDIAPPTLSTVAASGTRVTLTFNESLTATPTPSLSAFTVFVGETPVTPSAISIVGSQVLLTLGSSVPSGTEVRVSYVAPTVNSANTNAAIQDVRGNDAVSLSGTTNPPSTTWDWTTSFNAGTNTTTSGRCDGAGSINRAKRKILPNGVTYTVGVTGDMLCINEVTESLSERGGAAGMFVATGLVTEPGLKITTSNDLCGANEVCTNRGYLSLTFSQPVIDPVFSFAGWGGRSDGTSWSELKLLTAGITMTKLSGTNISITQSGTYIEDNGQASTTRCSASTSGSSAVCGSVQINGTVTTLNFEVFMQTSGGTGNEDAWNLTASMAEDFGLVPTTYESSGVASHGVGTLKLGATVAADQASALYATTNADAVARWTSLATNAKKDDGVAAWIDSPTIDFSTSPTYSTTVSLAGVDGTANLCGWIDFNRDEVFAYSERACATDPTTGATSATLTWTVPADVGTGLTYARVRLSYDTLTVATGKVGTGEVEDYSLVIPSNNLPSAVSDTSRNGQDVNQVISPLSNDQFDPSYPVNNATLKLCGSLETPNTCTQTVLTVAGEGTYTVNNDGTVTFNPLAEFTGTATPVRYQISDTQGTPRSTSAYITPTVIPVPVAVADTSSDLLNIVQYKNPLTNDTAGATSAPLVATTVRLCSGVQVPPNCTAESVSVVGGTYSVNTTTGFISFTPTTNFVGTAPSVTYQVADSVSQVASSTYTPTVVATPTASNDTSTGAWNVNQTISPFTNDTVATGHPLGSLALCGTSPVETPNSCSQPTLTTADGTYTVNTNGTVTFDPLPTFSGTVTQPVTYQAKDNLDQFVNATITPYVSPPTPPTAVADTSTNLVNVVQTMNVLANDTTIDPLITLTASSVRLCSSGQTSPNCNATSVSVTGGTYSVDTSTGVVSFTPTTDWSGTPTPVAYQVTDSTNQKVSSTYAPTVTAKPAATNDTSSGAWNVNQTITPLGNDTIATGHPLTSLKLCGSGETPNSCTQTTLEVSGQGTYTVNENGTVTFDPLPTFSGTATAVTYQAVDDLGQYVSATITPRVTAPATPVAVADTTGGFVNIVQTKNPLSNDTTADPLITLNPATVFLCGTSPAQTPPSCSQTSLSVTGGVYDVDPVTGVISFTPITDWTGTAPAVTYQVTDSTSQTASSTYTPTVYSKPSASNDTSSGAYDTNQTISPFGNDTYSASSPVLASSLKLCGSGETPNSCTLTSLTVAGEGTYTVNADGTVTFDPLSTFRGVATPVTYQAVDILGQYISATITPTVVAPTAPAATAETKSVLRGESVAFTTITGTSGLASGTQLQTSGATKTCLYVPTTTTCDADNVVYISGQGTFTLNPTTGVVTYVADADATAGTKTAITYRVTDITGQTATSTLTPVVPPAPTATADTSTGNYQATQTIRPLTNDAAGDPSAPLVTTSVLLCGISPLETSPNCSQTSLSVAGQGTYTVNNDGSVSFSPESTFTGTATAVNYQVSDSLGQVATSTITPTVRTPPDARADVSSGNYDTDQTINPLTNDVAGSGALDTTTVKLCGISPAQLAPDCTQTSLTVAGEGTYTVNPTTGVVTFNPLPTFTGTATAVTYQVSDVYGQTDSATITPTVGLPPIPTATANTSTGNYDTNQTINPLTNDTPGSSSFPLLATSVKLCGVDPVQSPNSCSQTSLTVAGEGTYTVNPTTGVVTFDPLPTFTGTATPVTYQAKDALDRFVNSTITPTVDPPPAPDATPETKAVLAGGSVAFTTITGTSGLATGTGLKTSGTGVTCLYTPGTTTCDSDNVVTISGEGTFTLNPTTGVVTYVALANATSGTKTAITYRVTDIVGQTDTATLTPVVPPRPTATADTSTGNWDVNQTISPLTNDRPGDASAPLVPSTVKLCGISPVESSPNCTKTSLTVVGEGIYTVNADGTVTFDPELTFTDRTATSVRYQVSDSLGQVANSTITPTVGPAPVPAAVNDVSSGAWDTNQTITPLSNDTADAKIPLVASTVKLCGLTPSVQTPPNCTQTSLTIDGQGTYTVNPDGTVTFDPVSTLVTTVATPPRYQATDTLGQVVNATITPTVAAPPPPVATPGTVSLIAGGTESFSPIFGSSGLARKATGGPDLTTTTVCIIGPVMGVCDPDNVILVPGQGTFTLNPVTGVVTYVSDVAATSGVKTEVTYSITDALGVTVTSTLTPTIYPKPTALPDSSMGVMGATQTLSPLGNDSPGSSSNPLVKTSIKLCGSGETAPACTQTSVTVSGEGTYTVNADGTVSFEPLPLFVGNATPMPYVVTDSLGQNANSTLNPKVVPPPAPITQLDTGTAVQGSTVVLSPWLNDSPGIVPAGVTGTVALVPTSIRLCGPTDAAPTCTLTTLTTDDGTYSVDTSTGRVTFVHRTGFLGTVTQPVTYQIANNWTGLSGIGIATNILIPTITAPLPPPPPAPTEPNEPKATNDAITGPWDTNQTYSPLVNDSFTASDADTASIRLCAPGETPNICSQTSLTVAGEGTYTVDPDGTVTFDPVPAFYGVATPITYQAMDKLGGYVNATITPTVVAPPDGAKVFNQSASTKPGIPQFLVPTFNGIPSTGNTFIMPSLRIWDPRNSVWASSVKTKDGMWEIMKGRVRFTPHMDFRGETTLPYSVQDTKGVVLNALLIVIVDEDPVLPETGASPFALLFVAFGLIALGVVSRRRALKVLF